MYTDLFALNQAAERERELAMLLERRRTVAERTGAGTRRRTHRRPFLSFRRRAVAH